MTGEDSKNYRSIVSRMWKEIKEDLERLYEYSDRITQMKNKAAGEVEKPAVKILKNHQKPQAFVDTDLDDTEDETESEEEPMAKIKIRTMKSSKVRWRKSQKIAKQKPQRIT